MVYVIKDLRKKAMNDKFIEESIERACKRPSYDEVKAREDEGMRNVYEVLKRANIEPIEFTELKSVEDMKAFKSITSDICKESFQVKDSVVDVEVRGSDSRVRGIKKV